MWELKAISYAVGFVSRKRHFPTEAQIGLSHEVEKRLFRLNFFRLRISTGGSSRKTRLFRLDPPVEKLSRKSFTRVFESIASPIPPPNTHPHGHTATHHTRYHTAVSYKALTLAWLSLLLLLASSQRGAFLVPLASSVYHTSAPPRGLDPMLPTTAAPAVALAALS